MWSGTPRVVISHRTESIAVPSCRYLEYSGIASICLSINWIARKVMN